MVSGLDEGVRAMSLGEKSELKCRYDALYMNCSMGPSIPPRANMLLTVELCQVSLHPSHSIVGCMRCMYACMYVCMYCMYGR